MDRATYFCFKTYLCFRTVKGRGILKNKGKLIGEPVGIICCQIIFLDIKKEYTYIRNEEVDKH